MTTEHDPRTRFVVSWLREDGHENAERLLLSALDEIDHTRQRRSWWPAWRSPDMNTFAKLLAATTAVVVVAVIGFSLLPRSGAGDAPPSPSPSPSSSSSPSTSLTPTVRLRTVQPFAGPDAIGTCPGVAPDPATCVEDPRDDSITVSFSAPASWDTLGSFGVWTAKNAPPDGAAVFFYRGSWLFGDPCLRDENERPTIAVGPSVDDFVSALVDHPSIDVTTPVDITLAGHSGKYLDLTIPADINECATYQPIAQHIYAQGPGHRWHVWVLDVEGVRVVVETNDFAGTPPQRLAEEQAIIDSLEIRP
jgi:hypothetical protein